VGQNNTRYVPHKLIQRQYTVAAVKATSATENSRLHSSTKCRRKEKHMLIKCCRNRT